MCDFRNPLPAWLAYHVCDLCGTKIHFDPIRVKLRDGEHPHCGAQMTTVVDACHRCTKLIPNLTSDTELEDVRKIIMGAK